MGGSASRAVSSLSPPSAMVATPRSEDVPSIHGAEVTPLDRAVNVPYRSLPHAPKRAFSIPLTNASVRA